MARQRVQVERLRTPTSSQAVATPVDTYVRPAEAKVTSRAQQIIQALAPAAETIAKIEYRKELDEAAKAQAEAERARRKAEAEAEAQKRREQAYTAKLRFAQAQAGWEQEFTDNEDDYLQMDGDAVLAKRNEYFNEQFADIQDPLVLQALTEDFALNQIQFQSKFNKAQKVVRANNALSETFDALNGTKETGGSFNAMADDAFKNLRDIYGLKGRAINDEMMKFAETQVQQGDRRLYTYLKSKGQHNVGDADRQRIVARIESEIARQDKVTVERNWRQMQEIQKGAAEGQMIADVEARGPVAMALTREYEVTNADGTTSIKTISPEMQRAIYSQVLYKKHEDQLKQEPDPMKRMELVRDQAREWYNNGLTNEKWKVTLERGADYFSMALLENPAETIVEAEKAYTLFKTVGDENEKAAREMLSDDDYTLFNSVKTLMTYQNYSFEDAFYAVRNIAVDPDVLNRVPKAQLMDAIDNAKDFSWSTSDAQNTETIRQFVEKNATLYMATGLGPELAIENAMADWENTFTRVGNFWVDTSAFRWDITVPREKVEEAFDLILSKHKTGQYEDMDLSLQPVAGEHTSYRIIDEVGHPVIGAPIVRRKDLQAELHTALSMKADEYLEAAKANVSVQLMGTPDAQEAYDIRFP